MLHCINGNASVERTQVSLEASGTELADVCLASFAARPWLVGVVCPTRVEVQAEKVAICTAGGVGDGSEKFVETLKPLFEK